MANKTHTKEKRMLVMQGRTGRNRASRPKSFKSEEKAKEYAKTNGIKEYSLKHLSPTKIQIIEK